MALIAPSLLSADFAHLSDEMEEISKKYDTTLYLKKNKKGFNDLYKLFLEIAKNVPKWRAISKLISRLPEIKLPTPNTSRNIIKCALLDIGKNSAIPCIIPKIIVSIIFIIYPPK